MTNAPAIDIALRAPSIEAITTMSGLRGWQSLKEAANIARVPLADRVEKLANGVNSLIGFDMGEFQYDPWFTQWSQGARGDDGKRSTANVYNFSFWQYVGASYYFGHQLVTIPPTVWTNAAHKNGVPSLGTVCLNWSENDGKYTEDEVAAFLTPTPAKPDPSKIYMEEAIELLLAIKNYYGFDGYLFNLEYLFSSGYPEDKLRQGMITLLSTLKQKGCQTAWYDFQFSNYGTPANYLNPEQWDFFQAVTYFQPNYWWGPYRGDNSPIIPECSWNTLVAKDPANALKNRDSVFSSLYCSIFAANRGSPPYKGTFFPALDLIKSTDNPPDYYTGLCLYYPAWVMYDFRKDNTGHNTDELPPRSFFHNNDQAFWTGTKDMFKWPDPNMPVNPIAPNQCIKHYLLERTVIKSAPFVTYFNDGEGDFYNIESTTLSTGTWNNLSDQSILPTYRFTFDGGKVKKENKTNIYHEKADYVFTGGSSLSVDSPAVGEQEVVLDLYRTQIKLSSTNAVQLVLKNYAASVRPILQILYASDVTLKNPQVKELKNGWKLLEYAVPADLANETMVGLNLQLDAQNTAGGYCYVGQLAFLDTASKLPTPLSKTFFGNATELDWSDIYVPTSHYRVYGELNGIQYLIGVVYNSVYRAQYGEAPNMSPADHIFNMNLNNFNSFVVQEVNLAGAAAKI